MYTGGHGFFGKVLTDSRFKAQKGSYFLLENTHWQIFGLDSAYDPRDAKGSRGDLYGEQAAWVAQTRALSVDRKCIVLSHHSPFSAFEEVHEGLHRQLQPIAERGDILAWFWGHEHRGAIYGPFNSIEWPVLLGNGGFPQLPTPPAPTPSIRSHSTDIDRDGFLLYQFGVLELQGSQCDFYLVDEDGRKGPVFNLA
jgi:hypothetical protein